MENNRIQKIINFCLKYGVTFTAIIIGIIGILSIFITAYFNATITNPVEKTVFKYSFRNRRNSNDTTIYFSNCNFKQNNF